LVALVVACCVFFFFMGVLMWQWRQSASEASEMDNGDKNPSEDNRGG